MIADTVRTGAYLEALRHAVKPGSVVVDIGAGPGIWSLAACRFGARKVYAIEPAEVIQVARELAAANGLTERIEFIQDLSTRISLPERADVVVTAVQGVMPLFEQSVPSILDARRRFLTPGGILIPQREVIWAAVVDAPELHKTFVSPWDEPLLDLDLRPALRRVCNDWANKARNIGADQLVTIPQRWAELDYRTLESVDGSGTLEWQVDHSATGHGLCLWFDSELIDGIGFSNAPGLPRLVFGRAFFPWPEAVALAEGDVISVCLQAKFTGSDYVWRWDTRVCAAGGAVKAEFGQSDAFAEPISVETLRRRRSDHVPRLAEDGLIDQFILARMDGEHSLDQIAHELQDHFPGRFADYYSALTRAGEISERYSR